LGIAVDPVSMPGIVDSEGPSLIPPSEFSELIPTIQSSLVQIDRFEVTQNSNLHSTYCRWLI
jgi:hypothetical protein